VNGFDKDERSAVRMSIETMKVNIARDLGLAVDTPDVDTSTVEQVSPKQLADQMIQAMQLQSQLGGSN
jgi:hypothetical protein